MLWPMSQTVYRNCRQRPRREVLAARARRQGWFAIGRSTGLSKMTTLYRPEVCLESPRLRNAKLKWYLEK